MWTVVSVHVNLLKVVLKKHLEKHYDPKSRLCKFGYKQYFKNDNGVTVCAICDEEIHPEMKNSRFEYETHLK